MHKTFKNMLKAILVLTLLSISGLVFADSGNNVGVAKIATNVTQTFRGIGQLMIAVAYIAGIGFFVASLFKFKQHKDNPTQIPLGTPIALLVIGISLAFLPSFFKPAQETLFGQGQGTAGGFTGGGASELPGAQ